MRPNASSNSKAGDRAYYLRRKAEGKTRRSVSVSAKLYERLVAWSRETGTSLSELVTSLVDREAPRGE